MLKITCISKEIKTKIWAAAKLPRSAQEDVGENLKGASKAVLNQHPDEKNLWKNFNILKKPDIPTFLIAEPAMRLRKRASGGLMPHLVLKPVMRTML